MHLLSIDDLTTDEIRAIAQRGADVAAHSARPAARPLAGCVVGVYFRRTSTRTRTAFSSGAIRLGAQVIAYGPDDLQENTGESPGDTGRVLSSMLDVLVARTAGPDAELAAFADQRRMSVINAMSAREHPTQALADLTTLLEHFGHLDGLGVRYVGEGNNTAAALALALTRFPGITFHVNAPEGYGLDGRVRERAKLQAATSGATFVEHADMTPLGDADVVYTTRWQTTGTAKADPDWRRQFEPFRVDAAVMAAEPAAVLMHDLPAHRDEEITADVLDGPRSLAFRQAEHKLHSAMAVLEHCAGDGHRA